MLSTRINIPDDLKEKFKEYCSVHSITMTKLLLDGALYFINSQDLPAGEKNSGKSAAPAKIYHCPYCGDELTDMTDVNRLKHIDICEKLQKGVFCSRIPLRSQKSSVLL